MITSTARCARNQASADSTQGRTCTVTGSLSSAISTKRATEGSSSTSRMTGFVGAVPVSMGTVQPRAVADRQVRSADGSSATSAGFWMTGRPCSANA